MTEHHGSVADIVVAVPLKGFAQAKGRLAEVLAPADRERLGRSMATRTLATVSATVAEPAVVTADSDVAAWAATHRARVIPEPPGGGLSAAARAAAATAANAGRPWFILHADLPWLQPEELTGALAHVIAGRYVVCPSYDGGTTGLGGIDPITFRYGPASFHRHLAAVSRSCHTVYVSLGFALDVDSPADLGRLGEE